MILHLLRMRRNVNQNVCNDKNNVSATTSHQNLEVEPYLRKKMYNDIVMYRIMLTDLDTLEDFQIDVH